MDRKRINIEILSLVDDSEVCYDYPWGRLSFFTLLSSLLTSVKSTDRGGKIRKYTIYGFLIIFQVVLLSILQPREEEVEQPYVYSLCVPDDAVDVRVDALVYEFVYGGQEYSGDEEDDGEEQGGQEFGGGEEDDGEEQCGQDYGGGEEDDGEEQEEIQGEMEQQIGEEIEEGNEEYVDVQQDDGNVGDYYSWSLYLRHESPRDNWPVQPDTEYRAEENIPQGSSYSGYNDDYYATNEHLNTLLAEQRSYFDDQFAEQRCYFDDRISGVRDEVLQQFDHLEFLVSNSSKDVDHQYEEMQRFMENMQREIQTSVAQMHGKFEEMMVVRHTGGGGGTVGGGDVTGCETVSTNPVVVDRGKKTLASSSISVDIPILCDVNKRKESQFLDWLMRSKPT
ncbi:Uncharacterized protein Adt_01817 [Abeliophyllum distichum]|uniref:DUF1985 domain-containing protein n=1 Tax=Abeliophyllum distichum TaxID=126358 RepID=A0ABD1VTV8_9LAMI